MLRWAPLLLASLLAGCVAMAMVGPGEVTVRNRVTAQVDSAWNRLQGGGDTGKSEVWTTEGYSLDRLVFYVGVKDGESLGPLPERKDRQIPRFRASMLPAEIVEMYEVFVTYGGSTFKRERLAPAPFAGGEGFRFEYSRVRRGDEVDMRGVGYGTVRNGELFMVIFEAPKTYYFGKHLDRAEAVVRSVRIRS